MSSRSVVAVLTVLLAFLPAPPVAAGGVPSRSRSADVSAALAVDPYHLHIGRRFGPEDVPPPLFLGRRVVARRRLRTLVPAEAAPTPPPASAAPSSPPNEVVGPSSAAYTLCTGAPGVLTGVSGRVTLSGTQDGTCRWLLSPSSPRPTDIQLELAGLGPGDLVQLRLPHGLTVLLWPAMHSGPTAAWSRTVEAGDILLELGRTAEAAASTLTNYGGPTTNGSGSGGGGSSSGSSSSSDGVEAGGGAAHLASIDLATGTESPGLRVRAVGLSWWPAREEEESRGASATMTALGATMAALMLMLVLGSCCSCIFRCGAVAAAAGNGTTGVHAPPHRVPTSLRLQLKPTPYKALGAVGDYFARRMVGGSTGAGGKGLQLPGLPRSAATADRSLGGRSIPGRVRSPGVLQPATQADEVAADSSASGLT